MKALPMSEPVLPTLAGAKMWIMGLPIFVSVLAFWLGLLAIPLRKGHEVRDILYRIMSCVVSSFIVGVPAMLALMRYTPEVFEDMANLAVMAQLEPFVGFLVLTSCVMLVSSIPGPWLVGSLFLFIDKQKDKSIDEVVRDLKGGMKS